MTICEKKAEKTKMGQDVEFFPLDSQFIFFVSVIFSLMVFCVFTLINFL